MYGYPETSSSGTTLRWGLRGISEARRISRRAGAGAGTERCEVSRMALASAMRSESDGGAGSNSVCNRIMVHPWGTVTARAWCWHRSNAPGSGVGDSGPSTAVASS